MREGGVQHGGGGGVGGKAMDFFEKKGCGACHWLLQSKRGGVGSGSKLEGSGAEASREASGGQQFWQCQGDKEVV